MDINGNRTIDLNSFFEIYRLADTHCNYALSASLTTSTTPTPITTATPISAVCSRKLSLSLPGNITNLSYILSSFITNSYDIFYVHLFLDYEYRLFNTYMEIHTSINLCMYM